MIYNNIKAFLNITKNIWVMRTYVCIVFLGVIIYLYKHKETLVLLEISHFELVYSALILSFICFFFYIYVHCITYRALDAKISYWQMFQVGAFSRLGVYIPGKVWYVANYYIFSRMLNIDSDKIGKNFIINNALLFFTGVVCSLFVFAQLPFLAQYFLFILSFFMIILIHPQVLNKIFSVLLRKMSQFSSENTAASPVDIKDNFINYSSYPKFIVLYFILWFITGLILFLCVRCLEPISVLVLPVVIAASAASLIIGLFAVFAPAGLGVREGVGAAILSQIVPLETAVVACVLWRFTQVIMDLVVGGIATVAFNRKKATLEVKKTYNG